MGEKQQGCRCGPRRYQLSHADRLLSEAAQVLEMGEYVVVLATSHVPNPPHEIRCHRPRLFIDLLQHYPDTHQVLPPFDAREGGARDAGFDDLIHGRLLLPPMICQL